MRIQMYFSFPLCHSQLCRLSICKADCSHENIYELLPITHIPHSALFCMFKWLRMISNLLAHIHFSRKYYRYMLHGRQLSHLSYSPQHAVCKYNFMKEMIFFPHLNKEKYRFIFCSLEILEVSVCLFSSSEASLPLVFNISKHDL